MMTNNPIKEKKTIFEKLKELGENLFRKRPKKECYFVSPYETEDEEQIYNDIDNITTVVMKSGMTVNEVREMLLKNNIRYF